MSGRSASGVRHVGRGGRRASSRSPMCRFNVRTIEQQLERTLIREQTFARLSVAFALVALVLSAVGLYGVIANAVSRRTKEIGIRLALGAEPWRVVRMIVKEAGVLIAISIAIGAPSALALGRTVQGLLFGVQPADAATAAIAIGALSAVAFRVCLDPRTPGRQGRSLVALRSE